MNKILSFFRKVALFPFNVFMGITTDATGGAKVYTPPIAGFNKRFQVKSALITVPVGGATNDIVQCLPIKKGWLVHGVRVEMVTAGAGTTITGDMGITGGVADGFDAAFDLKSAAGSVLRSVPADGYPAIGGFYATADDTIDLLLKAVTAMTTPPAFYLYADVENING